MILQSPPYCQLVLTCHFVEEHRGHQCHFHSIHCLHYSQDYHTKYWLEPSHYFDMNHLWGIGKAIRFPLGHLLIVGCEELATQPSPEHLVGRFCTTNRLCATSKAKAYRDMTHSYWFEILIFLFTSCDMVGFYYEKENKKNYDYHRR